MDLRPGMGENRFYSHDTLRSGLPSPRVEHFDGEVPPALSPLDAFAAQGRLLAKQLDESKRYDRRMSRLPPSSVARSLSQPRPAYFRSASSGDSGLSRQPTQKINTDLEEPRFRPQSEHPRISAVPSRVSGYDDMDGYATPGRESTTLRSEPEDLEEMPRTESPEDISMRSGMENSRCLVDAPVGLALTAPSRNSSTDSTSRLMIPRTLAPPASPLPRPSSSSRVAHPESSDDDYSSSTAGSTFSKPRKLSSSSAMSMPHSPASSGFRPPLRSPSLSSETSNNGTSAQLPRPSFNFSRPISRSSTSLSAPAPTAYPEPIPANQQSMNRGKKPNPIHVPQSTDFADLPADEPSSAQPTYVYSKYSLPRGRNVSRDSMVFAGLQTPHFEWTEPLFESPQGDTAGHERPARTPSPAPTGRETIYSQQASIAYASPKSEQQPFTEASSRRSLSPEAGPTEQTLTPRQSPPTPRAGEKDETTSTDSASTIQPQTTRSMVASTAVSAEDHLSLGIECHEKGSLKESTYHLRIAAKQSHPTAMLLYALACRHGWGMRPNQREGVQWLRKAVNSVGVELSDEPDGSGPSRAKELQKAYRAQFALSIYELGVSHLNGWGIEQDKSLALRCFEIAGQWGDVDAMAEAGFCYTQGVGCKKNMKTAARFYRMAEEKGMTMVGNSWYVYRIHGAPFMLIVYRIYKDKYLPDNDSGNSRGRQSRPTEKKPRSKSRTRSLFHRKKSFAAES